MLKGIKVTNTSFARTGGNIIIKFPREQERERASNLIRDRENETETKSVGKFKPKITICNVDIQEDDNQVVDTLIECNDHLQSIPDVRDKMRVIFSRPTAGSKMNYVLRCEPEVRKIIHDHGDKLNVVWGRYTVRDRYHVITCYHCQRYGHKFVDCKHKRDAAVCAYCAESHETRD